jgi:hypothetical protein
MTLATPAWHTAAAPACRGDAAGPGPAPDDPVPIVVEITRLLRSLPPPSDPAALVPWLAAKADLFDRIATATADPGLADDARAVAAAARHTLASLALPAPPSTPGGDAA